MELREYWRIVRRRLWLVVGLVLVVLIATLMARAPKPELFEVTSCFTVGLQPQPTTGGFYSYDRYYTWLASEYLVDDLAEVVRGAGFANQVATLLRAQGSFPSQSLAGVFSASTKHRTLTLRIVWHDAEELTGIAAAAQQVLAQQSSTFFGQLGEGRVDIRAIDVLPPVPVAPGLREQLDVPLRLLLALAAGVALTFVLHYLDDAVYDRTEVEELGIVVLGELPSHPHRRRFFWQRPQR